MLDSGIAMWQICCRTVVSSSVGGVRIAGVRSRDGNGSVGHGSQPVTH